MLHLDQSTWQRIVHLQAALLVAVIGLSRSGPAAAQVVATGQETIVGTVETVTSAGLTIRDADGKSHKVFVQGKKKPGIALSDGTLLAAPVEVVVRAEFPAAGLKPGQHVRVRCRMDQTGKIEPAVAQVMVIDGGDVAFGVRDTEEDASAQGRFAEREVTAAAKGSV